MPRDVYDTVKYTYISKHKNIASVEFGSVFMSWKYLVIIMYLLRKRGIFAVWKQDNLVIVPGSIVCYPLSFIHQPEYKFTTQT